MKNFFSNIIKKVKNFVANLTPATKIRYIVISVVTVAVATSLLITVSLNTNEPEAPTNPEDIVTGETATIDFDNEMIFDVSDSTSGSTAIEDTESSSGASDESGNITTDDDTSSKETPDEPDESTPEDEPQPTDPSQTNNDDPEPVITTPVQTTKDPQTEPRPTETTAKKPQTEPKPTEGTTKTPQTEAKPTETTTKTPQTEPKPTETTTKVPQTEPKPTETTTIAPQTEPKPTETQPQEDPPQQSGQFSVKEKKYDYNGANVSILQVENKSEQAYTITITGKFKDVNGKVVKTESKTFEGFPGGWSNYFVFQPGVKYSSASWDMKADVFNGNTVAQYFEFGGTVNCVTRWVGVNDKGEETITADPEINKNLRRVVGVYANFGPIFNSWSTPINVQSQVVIFDNKGMLNHIDNIGLMGFSNPDDHNMFKQVLCYISDILWSEKDKFVMPDNLKSVSGILAITSVTE